MCKNKINIFMLMIITFISFLLILLLKTVDLKKTLVQFTMKLGILLAFQNVVVVR